MLRIKKIYGNSTALTDTRKSFLKESNFGLRLTFENFEFTNVKEKAKEVYILTH